MSQLDPIEIEQETTQDEDTNDRAPLWKYAKKIEKKGQGGGSTCFQCTYCGNTYTCSHHILQLHLLKDSGKGIKTCNKVSDENLQEMKKLVAECKERLKKKAPKTVPLPKAKVSKPSSSTEGLKNYILMGKVDDHKKRKGGPLEKAFQNEARGLADAEVARMFYTGGLPFNLARNPHYQNSYFLASKLAGYVHAGYNALRTHLLQQEKTHLQMLLEPIKKSWSNKGVSVCSDGWTDSQRRPLINIIATCESGPMFLKALNCEGEYKDKYFIANFLMESIKDVGYENVVQVITDNAPVCRAAGLLIEARYPTIFWTPCIVHTLNLALKSICSPRQTEISYDTCCWISTTASDVMFITTFIMNHNMILSMYNDHCKLKLLSVADTRFASIILMFRRFREVKEGLQHMVISSNWDLYKDDDREKAKTVKQHILDDDLWDKIDYVISFTAPIYEMLRLADTDKPCLHLVYEWWDNMIDKVKESIYRKEGKQLDQYSEFFYVVYNIIVERWTKTSTPLHCLAHSLNPKYYSPEWLQEDPTRVAPNRDIEITRERKSVSRDTFLQNKLEDRSMWSMLLSQVAWTILEKVIL